MRTRLILAAIAAVVLMVWLIRGAGFTSRRSPWPLEARASLAVRRFLIPVRARGVANPVEASPDVVRAGMEHFADHCASCHANDGSGDTSLGRSLFPRAPDMRGGRTQAMTDGELFYVIERGVPFTGMPAWGTGTPDGERSSWELVRFIRHLPQLSAAEAEQMESLNPKSAVDAKRKKDIDDFLAGKGKSGG